MGALRTQAQCDHRDWISRREEPQASKQCPYCAFQMNAAWIGRRRGGVLRSKLTSFQVLRLDDVVSRCDVLCRSKMVGKVELFSPRLRRFQLLGAWRAGPRHSSALLASSSFG